jgi:alkylhydroperoxidase/carboxymuconolactone decarboxylase family protein YurZ
VVGEPWGEFVAGRAADLPPHLRQIVAGLYRLVSGEDGGELDAAIAGGADSAQLAAAVEVLVAALGMPVWTRAGWQTVARIRPVAPADRPVEDAAREMYAADGDDMPAAIGELSRQYPELAALFVRTRRSVVSGAGLDLGMREMMLSLLSAQGGYLPGARRHLLRARAAGLSTAAVADVLSCVVLIHGAGAWEAYGRELWELATRSE